MKLSAIKSNPNNPRVIKDENLKKLCKSIEEFPKMMELRPIVIDENNMVLGGNMRLKALKKIGYTEIPNEWVKKAADLTPEEQRRFIIADNVSGGEWDIEELKRAWSIKELDDWGIGIEWPEEKAEVVDDNYIPDENIKTDIKPGDIIEIGNHRLLCGDSTDEKNWEILMGGRTADLVITDPPYNVQYTGKTKNKLIIINDNTDSDVYEELLIKSQTHMKTHMRKGATFYMWYPQSKTGLFFNTLTDSGLKIKQVIIWVKNTIVLGRSDYHWKHEGCIYGVKEGANHYFSEDRTLSTLIESPPIDIEKLKKEEMKSILKEVFKETTKTSILYADKPSRSEAHPPMKPVLLIAQLIKNSSKPYQLIVDPFCGSGTTIVAAHQLNRACYSMELDEKYCQSIIDRMRTFAPEIRIKINGSEYTRAT